MNLSTDQIASFLKDPLLIQALRDAFTLEIRRRPEYHAGEQGDPYICLCLHDEIICSLGPREMEQFASNKLWTDQ